ncbi:MAG: anaerobic ribonucleoside-triphosphate reductase activating protein [Clostridia bacterium]|nr:anaerobic ribonucleoside-triphosphate reductase activating protein [Clostridia bacterium]
MLIMGLQKLTLLDFPGKMAATVFTGGCNFRCPFCHNASLVLPKDYSPEFTEQEFFELLEKRQGVLEGVCITGGEPTLQKDLPDFIKRIKDMGYLVKLDTNGFLPKKLKSLIDAGLVDYVAMDIKNCPEKYGETVGIESFNVTPILESVDILKNSDIPFEFRTTVVKNFHTEADIIKIGNWLGSDVPLFLQAFKDSGDLISEGLVGFDEKEMQNLLNVLKPLVPSAQIRGI